MSTIALLLAASSIALAPVVPMAAPGARPGGQVAGTPPGAHAGGDSAAADSSAEARAAGGPIDVFADIERGWRERNVDLILRHFGEQKVAISIDGTGPSGGTFSRNQSYYLLKDLFRYTTTKRFEFVQYRKPDEEGHATFAIADRQYQRTDDGRLFKDKVYVSLHLEGEGSDARWVVDEIKSIR